MPLNRRAFEIAAVAVALALLAVMAWRLAGAHGMVLANGQPLFGDFIAFWSAGRAAIDGRAADVHDVNVIWAYHQIAAPGVRYMAPWNSPPTFLLVTSALAMLPYPAAALLFLAASIAIYLIAARKVLPDTRALLFAVTMPAALYHLGTVQAGLLIAGVSALALTWVDRRPLSAGALVGLLAIKPHLALLWPVLLAFTGRWRAFWAAAASAVSFVLLAGAMFGFDAYLRFFDNLRASELLISGQRITTPSYASLFASALGLGAPQGVAAVLQGLSAMAAASVFVLLVFPRRAAGIRTSEEMRVAGAAMCAATLLISPYLFFYDFTLLGVGAALMGAPRDRFELVALVLAWGAGLSLAVGYFLPLPVCPLAAWVVLIAAFRRRGSAALPWAPAQRR